MQNLCLSLASDLQFAGLCLPFHEASLLQGSLRCLSESCSYDSLLISCRHGHTSRFVPSPFSDNRRTMADLSIYEARLSGFEQDQVVPKLMKFAKAAVKFDIPKMLPELVAQVRRCFWADCYYTWHSSKNLCPNAC